MLYAEICGHPLFKCELALGKSTYTTNSPRSQVLSGAIRCYQVLSGACQITPALSNKDVPFTSFIFQSLAFRPFISVMVGLRPSSSVSIGYVVPLSLIEPFPEAMPWQMGGRTDGRTDGRMDGWVGGWMDGSTDGWVDGWMGRRMDGRMDGWMAECDQPLKYSAAAGNWTRAMERTDSSFSNWAIITNHSPTLLIYWEPIRVRCVLLLVSVCLQREDGSKGRQTRPYIIDLGSANGTFVNNKKIEPQRWVNSSWYSGRAPEVSDTAVDWTKELQWWPYSNDPEGLPCSILLVLFIGWCICGAVFATPCSLYRSHWAFVKLASNSNFWYNYSDPCSVFSLFMMSDGNQFAWPWGW